MEARKLVDVLLQVIEEFKSKDMPVGAVDLIAPLFDILKTYPNVTLDSKNPTLHMADVQFDRTLFSTANVLYEKSGRMHRFVINENGVVMFLGAGEWSPPVETKTYPDGTSATGTAPLPDESPAATPVSIPDFLRVPPATPASAPPLASVSTGELSSGTVTGRPEYSMGSFVQPKITGYRQLTEDEAALMNRIKAIGAELEELIKAVRATVQARAENTDIDTPDCHRWAAIGKTDLQTGLMALTRAVAAPTSF